MQLILFLVIQNEAPGPGNYVGHGKVDNESVSLSKKGTGSFASKVILCWLTGLVKVERGHKI